MNTEQSHELARRAAVHAALADPARLLITDTLAEGDASPSELAALLEMPSNLLAHHLGVLEQAGLVQSGRAGRERVWQLRTRRLDEVRRTLDLISTQWDQALERLRAMVEDESR